MVKIIENNSYHKHDLELLERQHDLELLERLLLY